MYIRYFWQGIHHTYGHIRCRYTVLANPTYTQRGRVRAFHIHLHIHIIFTTFAHEALGALKYTHSTCIYARSTSIKYARSTSISTHAAQVSSTHAAQVYARNTCIRTQHMHTHASHAYKHMFMYRVDQSRIYTPYMYGDFPAKNTVCTLYIRINIWFWPGGVKKEPS